MQQHQADYTNTFRALTLDKVEGIALFGSKDFENWYEKWLARLERQQESKASCHQLMRANNPAVIPRNHRVEEALEAAVEQRDYRVMERLLEVLAKPFAYSSGQEDYATVPDPTDCPYQTFVAHKSFKTRENSFVFICSSFL